MSSIGFPGTLTMGARAMAAQRAAIEITGHNLSNVNTQGYARQRANLQTDIAIRTALGFQGLGVVAQNVQQIRNSLLDTRIPSSTSTLSYLDEKTNLLNQLQTGIGQPLDRLNSLATSNASTADGLAESLDGLFNAFQSLSAEPTSMVLRQQVVLKAQLLTQKLNSIGNTLVTIQNQVLSEASKNVEDINNRLAAIAQLNQAIASAEVGTSNRANDLRDARQQAIEELSKSIDVYTQEEADSTLTVRLGSSAGTLLVSGIYSGNTTAAATVKLGIRTTDVPPNVDIEGFTGGVAPEDDTTIAAIASQPSSGTLAAQLEIANTVIGDSTVGLIRDFDRIAAAVASLVNAQQAAGFTLENPAPLTPYNVAGTAANQNQFFDDDNDPTNGVGIVTARNIQVNSALAADHRKIAASSSAGNPNDGSNAVALAALRDDTTGVGLGGVSIFNYYMSSLTTLGGSAQASNNAASTQKLVQQQLEQQRESTMGVSLDEEMTNLMQFQHAFEASARLIATIDEMLQTLISVKR